jgi:PTS system cellobiose-specific IIB component
MKKIILVCNGGMSTSILANSMNKISNGEYTVEAYGEQEYPEHLEDAVCVLVAPQIHYLLPEIKKSIGKDIPIDSIDPRTYGTMNAQKVYEQVKKLTQK